MQFWLKRLNDIKAEIEIATRLNMEFICRIWLNLAKKKSAAETNFLL